MATFNAIDAQAAVDDSMLKLQTLVQEHVAVAGAQIILRSPVETGLFVGNWNFSVGSPDTSTGGAPDPSKAGVTRAQAFAKTVKLGDSIFVTNALSYAEALEGGASTQAPSGILGPVEADTDNIMAIAAMNAGL